MLGDGSRTLAPASRWAGQSGPTIWPRWRKARSEHWIGFAVHRDGGIAPLANRGVERAMAEPWLPSSSSGGRESAPRSDRRGAPNGCDRHKTADHRGRTETALLLVGWAPVAADLADRGSGVIGVVPSTRSGEIVGIETSDELRPQQMRQICHYAWSNNIFVDGLSGLKPTDPALSARPHPIEAALNDL